MKRRSQEKPIRKVSGSKYALKIKSRQNDFFYKTQKNLITEIQPNNLNQTFPTHDKLSSEEKENLITELEYGLTKRTFRTYIDKELRFIVGYCLTKKKLINNFSFLPGEAARYLAPVLRDENQREVAIEAFWKMKPEAGRFLAPVLRDEDRKKSGIEAFSRMDFRSARFLSPALKNKDQREAAIEAFWQMDFKSARFLSPVLKDENLEKSSN